jgi:hypothetical protein
MIRRNLALPEVGMIAGTRAALGVGLGLLIADRLEPAQRRAIGWTLVGVGILTTFPLAAMVFFGEAPGEPADRRRSPRGIESPVQV